MTQCKSVATDAGKTKKNYIQFLTFFSVLVKSSTYSCSDKTDKQSTSCSSTLGIKTCYCDGPLCNKPSSGAREQVGVFGVLMVFVSLLLK